MTSLVLKAVIFSLIGAMSAYLSFHLMSRMKKRRGLTEDLSKTGRMISYLVLVLSGTAVGITVDGIFASVCAIAFIVICNIAAAMDIKFRIIPNEAIISLFALKLITLLSHLTGFSQLIAFDIMQSLLGLIICFAVFTIPGFLGKTVGAGDVKFASAMGFFLGIRYALLGIVLMGLIIIGFSIIQRKVPFLTYLKTAIPIGPFISLGMCFVLIGAPLLNILPV